MKSPIWILACWAVFAAWPAAGSEPGAAPVYVFEFEHGDLEGCVIETNYYGADVAMPKPKGKITFPFFEPSGTYNVEIRYMDEWDGASFAWVTIGGKEVGSWKFDRTAAYTNEVNGTLEQPNEWQVHTLRDVRIDQGDTVEVRLKKMEGENARVDRITFTATPDQ